MSKQIFGTDGVRGLANGKKFNAELAYKIGMASAILLGKDNHRNKVIIAKDTRLSGYLVESALMSGFLSAGVDVMLIGPIPTPAIAMLIKSMRADIGVMISASHNPYYDNGLKIFDGKGEKLSDNIEKKIEDIIFNQDLSDYNKQYDQIGRATRLDDAQGRYIEYAKTAFNKAFNLEKMKIVIDCANGSGYDIAPKIFWELGAQIIPIHCQPNGMNINMNCGALQPEQMIESVLANQADIGIALDGDADRVIICNKDGTIISGDHILGAIAYYLKAHNNNIKTVILTQLSNIGLERYLHSLNIQTYRAQVGDRYVRQLMIQYDAILGGEPSGHIIDGRYSTTGDGIITALTLLSLMIELNITLEDVSNLFTLYPQRSVNIRYYSYNPLVNSEVISFIDNIVQENKDYKIIVRNSGTENLVRVMIEGENTEYITFLIQQITKKISSSISNFA